MSRLMPAETLASSMETTSRESVPAMRAKEAARLVPSAAVNETDPVDLSEPSAWPAMAERSEEHTSEVQSHSDLVCRLLLEKKKKHKRPIYNKKQKKKKKNKTKTTYTN